MNNSLIEKKVNNILTKEDVELLAMFNRLEKKVKELNAEKKEALTKFFEENNIDFFENEELRISYVKGSTKRIVDTSKMKFDGIYDEYLKDTFTNPSVRFTFKK